MNKINVAIAEDDFRVANLHEQFLLKIPEVEVVGKALNAEQTISLLQQKSIDLLLLDIYMPDELGTQLLPKIRLDFPTVDVVMITASTNKDFLEHAVRNGVHNYLIKPVKIEHFIDIIQKYIEKQRILEIKDEVDQDMLNQFFGNASYKQIKTTNIAELPKGIDSLTLEKVMSVLQATKEGLSAEEVGKAMGASRTTARRYLEYLISIKHCRAEVKYGIVGRPERNYYIS